MGRRKVVDDEALLAAARSVFVEQGAFGTTKEVARRAGVSEALIFQRYPTKAALFLAAMMPAAPDIGAIIATGGDPKSDLVETGLRMLAYFRSVIPTVMHLLTYPHIKMADVIAHHQSGMSPDALNVALAAHLGELHRLGEVKAPSPMASAGLFVSAIHSLALYERMELHGGESMDHAVAHFVDGIWTGLSPPAAG